MLYRYCMHMYCSPSHFAVWQWHTDTGSYPVSSDYFPSAEYSRRRTVDDVRLLLTLAV